MNIINGIFHYLFHRHRTNSPFSFDVFFLDVAYNIPSQYLFHNQDTIYDQYLRFQVLSVFCDLLQILMNFFVIFLKQKIFQDEDLNY